MTDNEGGYYRGISPSALRELLAAHDREPTWRDRVREVVSWLLRGRRGGDSEVQS